VWEDHSEDHGHTPSAVSKAALRPFERNGGLAAFQGGDTLDPILAVFQVLANGRGCVIALATATLFGGRLQFFFEFGFEANAEHSNALV
jgi:hypothetical protein